MQPPIVRLRPSAWRTTRKSSAGVRAMDWPAQISTASGPFSNCWLTGLSSPMARWRSVMPYQLAPRGSASRFVDCVWTIKALFQLPKSSGRSRHGAPVRASQSTASTNSRLSAAVRPESMRLPGKCGSIRSHW
jgi:hypothetical protein